jgi:hypothetical protein
MTGPPSYGQVAAMQREIDDLKHWVADLQAGMYLNCVFCGHRYGPSKENPPPQALKQHILFCPKHPLARLLKAAMQAHDGINTILAGLSQEQLEELRMLIPLAQIRDELRKEIAALAG